MKPSPQSHGFIDENQTPSAISDQKQQPSGQGYQGRTGKAINCQSLHRSTSQSATSTLQPPHTTPSHQHTLHQLLLYTVGHFQRYYTLLTLDTMKHRFVILTFLIHFVHLHP